MVRTHLRPPEKTRSGRILVLVRPFPESQREPPVHAPGGKGAPRAGGQHHHRSVGRPAPTAGTTGIAGACMAVSLMAAGAFRNWAGRHGRTGGGRIASAGHRHSIYPRHWHTAGHRWVPSTSGGRSRTFARAPGSAGTGRPGTCDTFVWLLSANGRPSRRSHGLPVGLPCTSDVAGPPL